MDVELVRTAFLPEGIFGLLSPDGASLLLYTLEHSYSDGTGFVPKIPPGTYTCVRGIHQLAGMAQPFETFEIQGVAGHTNLLFHVGNYNQDSEGCVLLGLSRQDNTTILHSKEAFDAFMKLQDGVDQFTLTVS